ncbi:hypothetical protein C9374_003758 [Naegleria lovaniensis]|uniref:VASt domain-containing protein n=1 Tax=Naegleria lovaniensis TaxID=51637 RepID=A0AA88H5V7_NAELO|nr:uncharacterized protein C9374_003758 [Naegleria lovaniensis]KAG2393994.1 hypothetical protein C9374_003758 [Naegleria lovaniensis]
MNSSDSHNNHTTTTTQLTDKNTLNDDDDSSKQHSSNPLYLKLNVSLSQVMDQLIFNHEFLKQFHQSQQNTHLKIIQEWTMIQNESISSIPSSSSFTFQSSFIPSSFIPSSSIPPSSIPSSSIPSISPIPSTTTTPITIHNYSQLISHMKFIHSSQPITLERIIQYNQNIIGNSYISYLGIPSQLPCQSNEKLILYFNKCEYIVNVDILETFLKDTSKTCIKYIIQYDDQDQMMVIDGMVQCTFESKLMWGLKSKIENYMSSMATMKLAEWFEMARIELMNRCCYDDTTTTTTTTTTREFDSSRRHASSNDPVFESTEDAAVKFNLPSSPNNSEDERRALSFSSPVEDDEEDSTTTTTTDSYYSTKSTTMASSSSPTTTTQVPTTSSQLIDHSYHLVKLKNEIIQLKALSNQLELKIKNLEHHLMAENQLNLLIQRYYSKISQFIHSQKTTRFRLKNRLKLLSLVWFIIGLFLTPLLYGLYRFYRYRLLVRK